MSSTSSGVTDHGTFPSQIVFDGGLRADVEGARPSGRGERTGAAPARRISDVRPSTSSVICEAELASAGVSKTMKPNLEGGKGRQEGEGKKKNRDEGQRL